MGEKVVVEGAKARRTTPTTKDAQGRGDRPTFEFRRPERKHDLHFDPEYSLQFEYGTAEKESKKRTRC